MLKLGFLAVLLAGAVLAFTISSQAQDGGCESVSLLAVPQSDGPPLGPDGVPLNPDPTVIAGWIANKDRLVPPITPADNLDELPDLAEWGFSSYFELLQYVKNNYPAGTMVTLPTVAQGPCF